MNGNKNQTSAFLSDYKVSYDISNITNGLETIRLLEPKKYKKTPYIADTILDDIWVWEAGLIGQDVKKIPELCCFVKGGEDIGGEQEPHYLLYRDIFTYLISAVKEMDTLVKTLQSRIEILEGQ
tara:strand:- start:524 stop:895 length:372 start_codon:yes stop_codon:yes gene_type:complete